MPKGRGFHGERLMSSGNYVNRNSKENSNVKQFTRTTIQEIPISQIYLGQYQKRLNKQRVASIVANFNGNRMRPIEVSLRDGMYWCWDGQHRLAGYQAMGRDSIPCQVHYGLTYEDEARLFAEQQDNVGTVSTAHKFNALREAKDAKVLGIERKCAEYHFTVHPTKAGGKNIRSIKTLQTIAKDLGLNRMGDILWVMESAWNHEPESTQDGIVGGLALFMKTYLVTEDCAKAYEANNAIINRLRDRLSTVKARILLQDSTNYRVFGGNASKRAAMVMLDLYNKGLRNKLPNKIMAK